MSPLKKGPTSIRGNVKELMAGPVSPARQKAIATIAKKRGVSPDEARFIQARAIAVSQSRKK